MRLHLLTIGLPLADLPFVLKNQVVDVGYMSVFHGLPSFWGILDSICTKEGKDAKNRGRIKNPSPIGYFFSGSVTINRVERSSLSQRIVPRCCKTMDWAMDSPNPNPSEPERALSAR